MKVLVLNCGSSSIKYQLFDMPARTLLAKGMVERIGDAQAAMIHQEGSDKQQQPIAAADHEQAMAAILAKLMHAEGSANALELKNQSARWVIALSTAAKRLPDRCSLTMR